ncbi:thioredoxin domain-containing protein [Saccharococcus caldoxylosilyticus]|uniref:thioredoxin domain-containing protein n=1 Tax=Saccharococcus caldoxylosilyticus TaxID=81408 RepID=UPI001C4DF8F2|nr:thioredoxin domain-containing protein [Parageobacillus caldoxylosilyticus]QXJ40415.1 Cellobiose 2-epimerase [Parageobacillus caldoxylosilyticus]
METNKKPNRLIREKSPYLLQHAYNPVDWYPWGEEAFAKAKKENKPIFLSIGYSTCHWCHVMAHESFEDEEVAAILNEKYISIKVDREERPDIDSIYMRVCQMLTGHGGWPLSVFLTPEGKPFYAGTYFPKRSRYGQPGFIDVLTKLYHKYRENPNEIERMAEQITEALRQSVQTAGAERLSFEAVEKAYRQLSGSFDTVYGGFGGAPKFPIPHMLMFLMRYYQWKRDERALLMVEKTLNGMANGGIYDHIGYGFARYSTDAMWLVPHFEKMLYDNALLAIAYTEAYQLTKNERYKEIAEQIIEFVKREMTSNDGAFYSAIDADSEGVEGKYYVWAPDEVINVLGTELGELYCRVYDITEEGNFEGKNLPNLIHTRMDRIARQYRMAEEELHEKLEEARKRLFAERSLRVFPHVDDKILTAWNALMIAALAKAAKVYKRRDYLQMAERALSFVETNLFQNGRLMVRYRDGEVKHKGIIDDYAFLVWAYIEMYEATLVLSYLQKAKACTEQMISLFWDEEHGAFFMTGSDAEELIVQEKEIYDGALPSGNSVAAVQLIRLARLTGDLTVLEKAETMYKVFQRQVEAYESGHTFFLQGLLLLEAPTVEVVLFGKQGDEKREQLIQKWQDAFVPNVFLLAAELPDDFAKIAPFAAEYEPLGEETTVYVCENFSCQQPTTDVESVAKQLFE